jgi:hypothetical protein
MTAVASVGLLSLEKTHQCLVRKLVLAGKAAEKLCSNSAKISV